jgi:hypothetical protein
MLSPTQRTLAWLRGDLGAQAAVVEKWNSHARIRQDLFGVIDIVATANKIIGVQACAAASHSARVKKSLAEPQLVGWLKAGGHFWVMSWGKKGARGKVKRWTHRTTVFVLLDGLPFARETLEQQHTETSK